MKSHSFGIIPLYIKNSKCHFLMIRHKAGHWAFPKGHQEDGETEIMTARRELHEETGIEDCTIIEDAVFVEHYSYTLNGTEVNKSVTYFLGLVEKGEVRIQEEEISEYRWAVAHEAEELITFNECRALFKEVKQYINQSEEFHAVKFE